MPRLKGIGMPSKRKRKTAKLQEVPEPDADEVDQGSACGPASPTHSSPPTVDSDEDLMPLERELATAEHDLASPPAARQHMTEACGTSVQANFPSDTP